MIDDPGRVNQADDPDEQSLPKTKACWHQTILCGLVAPISMLEHLESLFEKLGRRHARGLSPPDRDRHAIAQVE